MYRYVHRRRVFQARQKHMIAVPLGWGPNDIGEDGNSWITDEPPPPLPDGAYLVPGREDDGYLIDLPSRWEICGRCQGNGKHTNPSIDGNGLTAEDFEDWDEDQIEGYFSGRYDVPCEAGCDGGKVRVVDEDLLTPEQLKVFEGWCEDESAAEREGREDARTRWYEDGCPRD